jgi:hypothetical protein
MSSKMQGLVWEIFIGEVPVDPHKAHSRKDHLRAGVLREIIGYLHALAARDPKKERFAWASLAAIARACKKHYGGNQTYSTRWVRHWLRIAEAQGWIVPHTGWRHGIRRGWIVTECPRASGRVCCCALKEGGTGPVSPPPAIQADIQAETIAQLRAENAQLRALHAENMELRKALAASPISLPTSALTSAPLPPPLPPPPPEVFTRKLLSHWALLMRANAEPLSLLTQYQNQLVYTWKSRLILKLKRPKQKKQNPPRRSATRLLPLRPLVNLESHHTSITGRRFGSWPDIRRSDTEAFVERRATQLIAQAGGQPTAARSITRPEVCDRLHEFFATTGIQPRSLREAELAGAVLMANTWADEYRKTRDPARIAEMLSKCMSRYKPLEIRWPKVTLKLWGAIVERGDHPLCTNAGDGGAPETGDRCDA